MLRSLKYYWKTNVAVGVAAAVMTATLTGALVVGDSVRGSLRDLALDRLGGIDYALASDRFFSEQIAAAFDDVDVAPAILLSGAAVHGSSSRRASSMQIVGVDERFWAMYDGDIQDAVTHLAPSSVPFPAVVVNASLADELGARVGDDLLLTFQQTSDVPRESLFGRKGTDDVVQAIRVRVVALIPDNGAGRFRLQPHQGNAHNAYVELSALQSALQRRGRVNGLLISTRADVEQIEDGSEAAILQSAFDSAVTLGDLELELVSRSASLELLSDRFILSERTLGAALAAARRLRSPVLPVFTYLANSITATNGRSVPYSTISALDLGALQQSPSPFGDLQLVNGSSPPPLLAPDELLINEWAADDLGVSAGDSVTVSYYEVGVREQLLTRHTAMRVAGVVALAGLGADRTLTPAYPGIQEAGDMSSWSAPFPVDFDRIRKRDEAYWDEYEATPKAFVSQATGLRLWSSRFGNTTSIRFGAGAGMSLERTAELLHKELRQQLQPGQLGLAFQPVKAQALQAASGATDFSGLFVGFSMFLIAAAALLTALLFRLGVEQRVREIGLLAALGFTRSSTRRRMLGEAALVAAAGGLLGLAGAWSYGWLMMAGLRTWWLQAVGTTALFLHAEPITLIVGWVASLAIVLVAIQQTVRRLLAIPARSLIAGTTTAKVIRASRRSRVVAIELLLAAIAITMGSTGGMNRTTAIILFFAGGGLLLIAGLTAFSHWLRREPGRHGGTRTRLALSAGNCRRHPGRSMACVALVASACFVIVAVGANRNVSEVSEGGVPDREGAGGGFTLVAQADIPIHQDLNSDAGRFELGLVHSDATSALARMRVFPFRRLPGEDASCLNLYKPQQPSILGATPEFVERGGFRFKQAVDGSENPWALLEGDLGPGVIPVIGDYNSVLWILHLGLGDDLILRDEGGDEVRLRFVALLDGSLFQSELIIAEHNFLHHFPSRSGFGFFAVEAPPSALSDLTSTLESSLRRYGFDVQRTAVRLRRFADVQNTYLSTFQTLGGLGLLLGTIGLGVVLLRNVLERTGEVATLRAIGFKRSVLSRMLVVENGFLLVIGVSIGTVSALVAVAPHLIDAGGRIPSLSLVLTLAIVVLVGLAASAAAAAMALRTELLPTLKAE